jgi:hypothetical protein
MEVPIAIGQIIIKLCLPTNLKKMLWLESDRMGFLLDAVTQSKLRFKGPQLKMNVVRTMITGLTD